MKNGASHHIHIAIKASRVFARGMNRRDATLSEIITIKKFAYVKCVQEQ
jgi:hypothetical protein